MFVVFKNDPCHTLRNFGQSGYDKYSICKVNDSESASMQKEFRRYGSYTVHFGVGCFSTIFSTAVSCCLEVNVASGLATAEQSGSEAGGAQVTPRASPRGQILKKRPLFFPNLPFSDGFSDFGKGGRFGRGYP